VINIQVLRRTDAFIITENHIDALKYARFYVVMFMFAKKLGI